MKVELKKGSVIDASETSYGTNRNGNLWGRARLKAEKGYNEITVWFNNPEVAQRSHNVVITEIESIAVTDRKYMAKDGTEKWIKDYSANVLIAPAPVNNPLPNTPQQTPASAFDEYLNGDFMKLPDAVNDDGLPFA